MTKSVPELLEFKPIIAWLRKQNPRGRYRYLSNSDCLFCQYLRAKGFENVSASGYSVTVDGNFYAIPEPLGDFPTPEQGPQTYGAALKRAIAAAAVR